MNKKRILAVAILGIFAASIAAYGIIKYVTQVPSQVKITGFEIALWRLDTNMQVTQIDWGSLDSGTVTDTESLYGFTRQLVIKNTGDHPCWVAWNVTGLTNGVTMTCDQYIGSWLDRPQNTGYITYHDSVIDPGSFSDAIRFTLAIPSDAPRGTVSFSITLFATTIPP